MKRWTYRQITEATEKEIRGLKKLEAEADSPGMAHVYRCMASGAVATWRTITTGWHPDDREAERMQALADAKP